MENQQTISSSITLPDLAYRGSVKDVRGPILSDKKATGLNYLFEYSDRYSVFDWGEMPDTLPQKGMALASLAHFFFTQLEKKGIKHHSLGLMPSPYSKNILKVRAVNVLRPPYDEGKKAYDYSAYQKKRVDTLVPLEILFRFGVPSGSSLLKRANNLDYCKTIGLDHIPVEGERFKEPILEFTTKLESTDRFLSGEEAQTIAGLEQNEMENLKNFARTIAMELRQIFSAIEVELWDGKIEVAYDYDINRNGEREFLLVDSIGPDELRLTYKGVHLSKEVLRQVYRSSAWAQNVERSKKLANERGVIDWKKICREEYFSTPEHLPSTVMEGAAMIYKSLAKLLYQKHCGQEVFADAWDLPTLVDFIQDLKQTSNREMAKETRQ